MGKFCYCTAMPSSFAPDRRMSLPRRRWSGQALRTCHADFVRSLSTKRPDTRGTYERALRSFLRWADARGGVRFTKESISRYKGHLERHLELSPASVSTYLTALRRFLSYLVAHGLLAENPAEHVPGNARPRSHVRRALTAREAEQLIAVVQGTQERELRDAAMLRLMLSCGLSDVEVVRADVGDLRRTGARWVLAVQGKGHRTKDMQVGVSPDVLPALRAYLASRRGIRGADPLFVSAGNSSRGRRMTTRAVRDRINRYLEMAGLRTRENRTRITAYSLRHTAAALLARRGASADEIRRCMRFGTLETAHLYLHTPESTTDSR